MQKKGYASTDRPWLKYYSVRPEDIVVPEASIYQLFIDNIEEKSSLTAINYYNVKISYKEFNERIHKAARAFKALGINKGEIVCTLLPNIPEARIIMYALNILGAIFYPINFMLSVSEYRKILEINRIKTVIIFDMFSKKYLHSTESSTFIENIIYLNGKESIPGLAEVESVKSLLKPIDQKEKRIINYSRFLKMSNGIPEQTPYYKKDSVAVIIGTSGTTGTPKGVCLTNENMNAMALQHKYSIPSLKMGTRILDVLLLAIGYGITVAHYSGVLGLEVIMIPTLATDILPLLKKYTPNHFAGGPIHYERLIKEIDGDFSKLPPQDNMCSGGASLDKSIESILNQAQEGFVESDGANVYVRQGLGCTENGGAASYAVKGSYKFGGVGIPLILTNIAIFRPDAEEELKYNETGEICISGPTVMKEYLNNSSETAKVLKKHSDGTIWIHTGDLGHIDEDGQVYIVDRIKNIFMRMGFNVHPNYISSQIKRINGVKDCYVVGLEHPSEQKVPVAFVIPADNYNLETLYKTIMEKCTSTLEDTSIPYDIVFVDQFPLNLGGKIDSKRMLASVGIDYVLSDKLVDKKLYLIENSFI